MRPRRGSGVGARGNRGRWLRSHRLVLGVIVAIGGALGATGGYIASAQSTGQLPHPLSPPPVTQFTGGPPPTGPPPTVTNPWKSYWTNVSPGSPIEFVNTMIGWRLNEAGRPILDNRLVSGRVLFTAWPGTAISKSTDGGSTWKNVFSDSTGIWGMDFLTSDTGWAVGVTTLERTSDGGASWQEVGEPAGTRLVFVHFVSATVGYGLTTSGQLVQSNDGGLDWAVNPLATSLQSLCFASASVAFGAATTGNVYTTSDGGNTWTLSMANPAPGYTERTQLSCLDNNAVVVTVVTTAPTSGYIVEESTDSGATWSLVADHGTSTLSLPPAASPLASLSTTGAAVSPSGIVDLVSGSTRITTTSSESGLTVARGRVRSAAFTREALPPPATWALRTSAGTFGSVKVLGAELLGSTTGWMYIVTQATSQSEWALLHTANGGSSWSVLSQIGPQAFPATG